MILVIGGCFQGKRDYVKERFGISEEEILTVPESLNLSDEKGYSGGDGLPEEIRAVNGYHRLIRRQLAEGMDPGQCLSALLASHPGIILIADEVGMGVIPLEREERDYREAVGRTLIQAAKQAESVHRVICGIGVVLK